MPKWSTMSRRVQEYGSEFLEIKGGTHLQCRVCKGHIFEHVDSTTVARHLKSMAHLQNVKQNQLKEDTITNLRQKSLLDCVPENEQFLRDFACVFACCGIAAIHAPTVLTLFQKYAGVESVMNEAFKIPRESVTDEQRKAAIQVKKIIGANGDGEYFEFATDETPGNRDRQYLQFAFRMVKVRMRL